MTQLDSYIEMKRYLSKGRNKDNRPAPEGAKNTRIIRLDEHSIGLKLHDTVIVIYSDNGTIQLNTDGWQTVTTRERMNRWQNKFSIHQTQFIWYITYQNETYLFEDNMYLTYDNKVLSSDLKPIKPYDKQAIKKAKALKCKVDAYCNEMVNRFINQKLPMHDAGDCLLCSMVRVDNNEPLGMNDSSHILSHIKEKYYVPSLFNNMINEALKPNQVYGLAQIDKHNIAWCYKQNGWESTEPWGLEITEKRLKMLFKRYIRRHIGLGVT